MFMPIMIMPKHYAQTLCLGHLSPVNLELVIPIDELGILIGSERL